MPGDLPFEIFESCEWPEHTRLAIGVRVPSSPPAGRTQVRTLLEHLWAQARSGMGDHFPWRVQICVFDRPGGWSPDFLGCLTRGTEPPAEGEEIEDGGEEAPDLENHARFSPAEEGQRVEALLAGGFPGARKPRVTVDEAQHRLTVTYPYLQPGTDLWQSHLTCAEVVAAFLQVAWTFYPATTDLTSLEFDGVSGDGLALRVELPDQVAFLAMDPWPLRERLGSRAPVDLEPELKAVLARLSAKGVPVQLDATRCTWRRR
jgi:hypothetical protein